jgi:serine/threonine protein kinase
LGEGSFGKVLGGIFGPSEQAVAVKLLNRDPLRIDKDSFVDDEIKALTHLVHPCIVRLFGVIWTTFNVQLFLQWHEMSLRDYLARRPAEAKANQVALCILKGLSHMHAAGYVHRDLKPANILVDRQPLAAIISDLGAAHFGEDGLDIVTTLKVRAPEIMLGYAYSKASDIWSLGCIFAEVEQSAFFYQPLRGIGPPIGRQAAAFMFMQGLAMKICPKSSSKKDLVLGSKRQGLHREVLKLGHLEAGVVGARFSSPSFQTFMERLLHFQPQNRATAEDLLGHPWLQTQEFGQPLAAS